MDINCKEIECKSAMNKINSKYLPFKWDLNIYRGCGHRCRYCYAIYSHKYMEDGYFFDDIYVKKNVLEALERELRAKSWKQEAVNIGGVTDSYQKLEEKYMMMPEVLKLMIKYRTPVIISTKSDLILRDIELLDKLSRITYVNISCTITTTDEDVAKDIEPNAVSSKRRFEVLKEFRKKTNASVGLHDMPIIPFITDSYDNLNELYYLAKEINVHYVLPGVLNLKGETRKYFLDFLYKKDIELHRKVFELYKNGGLNKEYSRNLYSMVNDLLRKYNLTRNYGICMKEKMDKTVIKGTQLNLFNEMK